VDVAIEAHGLTKRYGGTVAVDDLSFTVRSGRVTGFVGPNGAGKSTTMRMILGLGFSLGMAQRLGIAAALLGDPPVLILDEPVNGLDPEGIRWIRGLLRSLADEGRAVFVSSHLMSELEGTADDLIVIGRGRLIADTSVDELLETMSDTRVDIRSPQAGEVMRLLVAAGGTVTANGSDTLVVTGLDVARIADLAADHGLRLHELTPRRASLEEAFMGLTGGVVEFGAEAAGRSS
jgi:ABC-2 type transport system ATP-binding protein